MLPNCSQHLNISPSWLSFNPNAIHLLEQYSDMINWRWLSENPNAMLDRIIIPYDKIGYNQEYIVKTKVDPTKCKILIGEEGRNIDFKFEEIEYVKPGQY